MYREPATSYFVLGPYFHFPYLLYIFKYSTLVVMNLFSIVYKCIYSYLHNATFREYGSESLESKIMFKFSFLISLYFICLLSKPSSTYESEWTE